MTHNNNNSVPLLKKFALYLHIVLLLTAAGALICIYFINDDKTDMLIQATFWLVLLSSAMGIIGYRQTIKRE